MKCIILGCGGSLGTPEIGCRCATCTSTNPKNKRTRPSVYIEHKGVKLLIDASTDLRLQALTNGLTAVDALILTHSHADHVAGLDDMKPFARAAGKRIPTYLTEQTWQGIKGGFSYMFEDTESKIYKPLLDKHIIPEYHTFQVQGLEVQTFSQMHGDMNSLGIRVGNLAYSTDVASLPARSLEVLAGVDVWIVDCMRYHWSPTHSNYERTLDWIAQVKPRLAIITHMAHEVEYEQISGMLPDNVKAAYDGMVVRA